MSVNQLILGDNLEILKGIEGKTVDLIYLDPPFFSNKNYEVIWGDEGEVRSFQDRWSGGMEHYLEWLNERVKQMYRILKDTGSIFLHCDWHADAEIKVFILNKIFGENNFRGDIVWLRANAHNDAKKKLAVLTDTIWYYSKSKKCTYNPIYVPLSEQYTADAYRYEDEKGKYRLVVLTGPRINPNDKEWKGYHPKNIGRSWSVPKEVVNRLVGEVEAKTLSINERLDLLFENGYIEISKNGTPNYKRYLELSNEKGLLLGNFWDDIKNLQGIDKERIGYPTQKPEKLLQRIIEMASNEGDVVLDPFMGGGTTIAVADKLNRKWIGIDQSVAAVKVTEMRLNNQQELFSGSFTVQLHKYDYDTLRNSNAFAFESWIIQQFGGVSNTKQRNDFGLDGKMPDDTPIQAKRSEDIGRNVVDNFLSAIKRANKKLYDKNIENEKPVGYIIAFTFGKGAIREVARLKLEENIIIKLVTVEEIIPIAKKPTISVKVNELPRDAKGICEMEFIASGHSDAGIEFYNWDFNYDAEKGFRADIMIDKEGKQTLKLKAGAHIIAAKVVDNDGLDSVEIIKLKVNGAVERE